MNHNQVKDILFEKDINLKEEFDELKPLYEIRKQLIKFRLEQGLSQKELAVRVGTKQSAISRTESGDHNMSIVFLNKIAHALGKEIHIMIG